jgi:hypothetical protein
VKHEKEEPIRESTSRSGSGRLRRPTDSRDRSTGDTCGGSESDTAQGCLRLMAESRVVEDAKDAAD